MIIYLIGKGLRFLTGESSSRTRQESSEDGRDRASAHRKYIMGAGLPGDDDCLPRSSKGTEALATDSERRRAKKELQYLFPQAAQIETDTLHSLSPPPPKTSSRALPLFGIKRTRESPGRDSE